MAESWTRTQVPPASTSRSITITTNAYSRTVSGKDLQYLDLQATVNSANRLLFRLRATPTYTGKVLTYLVEQLVYASAAASTYTNYATPFLDAEADQVIPLGIMTQLDLNAFYNTAGDTYP